MSLYINNLFSKDFDEKNIAKIFIKSYQILFFLNVNIMEDTKDLK